MFTFQQSLWSIVSYIANDPRPTNGRPENPSQIPVQPIIRNVDINRLISAVGFSLLAFQMQLAPALSAGVSPGIVAIEGAFGKVEVNVETPSLTRLYLRGPNGLSKQSLLAATGLIGPKPKPWASGGYTYLVGQDGRRYESRLVKPDKVSVSGIGDKTVVRIKGVKLVAVASEKPVAIEDWTLSAPGDGLQLVWQITRRWQKDFRATLSGSPALFSIFGARGWNNWNNSWKNSVTSTIWYDPLRIDARPGPGDLYCSDGGVGANRVQTIKDRDTWMICKLWTNWHAPADLRLKVHGGHLYRRGVTYALVNEVGAVTGRDIAPVYHKGQSEDVALMISAVDKQTTGYQLAITLPDKTTEAALKDFYGSVLNGGAVNDQKGFDLGNESDGVAYAGSSWMYGAAISAGTPAPGQLSAHPYDVASAFWEHLLHIVSTVDAHGRTHFGYNAGGQWVDDNLSTIIGMRAYLLHSGDLAFVRQNLPVLERMLNYFIARRDPRGLFKMEGSGAHWYYDAVVTSGMNGYYNAYFYKAAIDLAEMEAASGRPEKAKEYEAIAQRIKTSFNEVLWKEDAPGGPRYLDWIDAQGKEVSYFCDLCQWPAVAVGIASHEQARKIVATADARIAQLEKEHGYQGYAGLSALWPVPPEMLKPHKYPFGIYMNGGSLLCQTYWEIMARIRAGDNEGAVRRLKLFARRAAETSWAGDNAATIKGEMNQGDGEPYLADMVATVAAAIHGVLGINPTWERLEVTPHLPAGWTKAEAEVLYKGQRHRITIEDGKVQVQPLEQVISMPLLWVMDFNLRTTPTGAATTSNVDFHDPFGGSIALKKSLNAANYAASGSYQSPPCEWGITAKPTGLTVAAELNGGQVTATAETSNDGFKTVSSSATIRLRDGVNSYSLDSMPGSGQAVRVRLDLTCGPDKASSPVVDGFRITAKPIP